MSFEFRSERGARRIQGREAMDQALYNRNQHHFAQAEGTTFTQEPLQSLLGFGGNTEFGDAIIRGDALLDDYDIPPTCKDLLRELQQIREPLPSTISKEAFSQGFKKWK